MGCISGKVQDAKSTEQCQKEQKASEGKTSEKSQQSPNAGKQAETDNSADFIASKKQGKHEENQKVSEEPKTQDPKPKTVDPEKTSMHN